MRGEPRSGTNWLAFDRVPCRSSIFLLIALMAFVTWTVSLLSGLGYALVPGATDWLTAEAISVDEEASFFTWLSSSLLLLVAIYLALTASEILSAGGRFRWHWAVLAAGFLALSAEEIVGLHEYYAEVAAPFFDRIAPGWKDPTFAWAALGLVAAAGLGALYLPFLAHLPKRIRSAFMASAVLYLAGAGGLELVAGSLLERQDYYSAGYVVVSHLEEGLEFAGVLLFFMAVTFHRHPRVPGEAVEG